MNDLHNPFLALNAKKKVLLAAHRGTGGGNIPCNSIPAFQIALNHGADIIELDVENSSDGKLYIQHPGMELVHLRFRDSIRNYPSEFVEQLHKSNVEWGSTQLTLTRLEEALDFLNGKCIVNIDKFWGNPERIAKLVRERHMEDQVLIKTSLKEPEIDDVEKYAPDLPFMPMVKEEDPCLELFAHRNVRYVGSEAIFKTEDSPMAQPEYIEKMHAAGKTVWVNAIVYNYRTVLGAGHNDDVSIVGEPDKGWGWLADRGYDIIQTDWIMACHQYLQGKGLR